MRIAVPEFNGRVSPVFDSSRRLLLFEIDGKKIVPVSTIEWADTPMAPREKKISSMGVDVLLCGGISSWLSHKIEEEGIILIPWVSGEINEIISAFLTDQLPGPGFSMPGCWGHDIPERRGQHGKRKIMGKSARSNSAEGITDRGRR